MNNMNIDGRSHTEYNSGSLLEVVVEKILLRMPGKVFSVKEIYEELVGEKLYNFSPYAKTPCNSIYTRLSTAVNNNYPHLCKAEKGHYFAK